MVDPLRETVLLSAAGELLIQVLDRPHHAQQRLRHVVDTVDRGLQTRRQLRVPLTELPDACCVLKSSPRRVST